MKKSILLYLCLSVLAMACEQKGNALDAASYNAQAYPFYLPITVDKEFSQADFESIQSLANANTERLDEIPCEIAIRLLPGFSPNSQLFCRNINVESPLPCSEFRIYSKDKTEIVMISFSELGQPKDVLAFPYARGITIGNRPSQRYYADYNFRFGASKDTLVVSILDTTNEVIHPSHAPVVHTDHWVLDDARLFKKAND